MASRREAALAARSDLAKLLELSQLVIYRRASASPAHGLQ
jgi:hypothetical protein